MSQTNRRRPTAFTLVELLVVIGIIAVLVGILVPVVAKMRVRAQAADTQNFVNQLVAAIEQYHNDFRAYPGPLGNSEIRNAGGGTAPPPIGAGFASFAFQTVAGFDTTSQTANDVRQQVTMSENLVLGLLGGLVVDATNPAAMVLRYNPSLVGNGATSLNPANPKKYPAYLEGVTARLSWRTVNQGGNDVKTGRYQDGTNFTIDDSIIPEFVDNFADPMPILYLRAKPGVAIIPNTGAGTTNAINNSVITNDPGFTGANGGRIGAYDLSQVIAYTASYNDSGNIEGQPMPNPGPPAADYKRTIGVGKTVPTYYNNNAIQTAYSPYHGLRTVSPNAVATPGTGYYYPLDAYAYFENPASRNSARQKDSFILISAGIDRMYGTSDDIVNFGSVLP